MVLRIGGEEKDVFLKSIFMVANKLSLNFSGNQHRIPVTAKTNTGPGDVEQKEQSINSCP